MFLLLLIVLVVGVMVHVAAVRLTPAAPKVDTGLHDTQNVEFSSPAPNTQPTCAARSATLAEGGGGV